jgi:hypothetical protein
MLGSSAEKELEQEIDNDNAKVVRGDGVVATADEKADRKALGVGADIIESDGEEGKNSYPSWVRPKHWYLGEDAPSAEIKALAAESLPTKSGANLRRIKSAISIVLPNSTNQTLLCA